MHSINLSKFTKYGGFIEKINSQVFDTIVFEYPTKGFTSIVEKGYNCLQSKGSLIIILDKLSIEDISQHIKTENVTIIQPHSGIISKSKSLKVQDNDVSYALDKGRKCYECSDLYNLEKILSNPKKLQYIRIKDQDYPVNIFNTDKEVSSLIDMTTRNYQGSLGTILCDASLLPDVTQACNTIMQSSGDGFDLFAFTQYNFKWRDSLLASIRTNNNLIIITDQKKDNKWVNDLIDEVAHHKIRKSNIHQIYPDYKKVTSIIPEYMKEQANFDSIGIHHQLQKLQTQN